MIIDLYLYTAVQSRLLERHVVRSFIYPALKQQPDGLYFGDQFAFRPTGSTAAALIVLIHTVLTMLSSNAYVRVFALDFSKAFDTVRHATLIDKMSKLQMPDQVFNWVKDFFDGHTHCTRYAGDIFIRQYQSQCHTRLRPMVQLRSWLPQLTYYYFIAETELLSSPTTHT